MRLEGIEILNFKNIASCSLELSPGVNCLLGRNGMGKSNLLEAVHFLCMARGMSHIPESCLLRHGTDLLMVKGRFADDRNVTEEISCGIVRGKGKTLKHDGKEYDRISEHIGRFPVVTVTPADHILVSGGGEERRKLTDMVISQSDGAYLSELIRYTRALDSRNRMLRAGVRDDILYESVEHGMIESAHKIYERRKEWVESMRDTFKKYYSEISGTDEEAGIAYKSVLADDDMKEILKRNTGKDFSLGYTSRGVHRDDMEMTLGGYSIRRLGSQGQVKTYTIALRLAIFDYLRQTTGKTPLLLLDDIFDKLDSGRVGNIMQMVSANEGFGQIFITDTNREHLDETLAAISGSRKLLSVTDGSFSEIR